MSHSPRLKFKRHPSATFLLHKTQNMEMSSYATAKHQTTSLTQPDNHRSSGEAPSALGLPERKKYLSYTHLTAVLVSLICFVLGVVTITPSVGLAWRLRFSGQIIVLGFLLGVMNICLQTVLPFTFLLLEVRFGRSRLQNLEAILVGKFLASDVSTVWKITLLGLLVLPLGLSIAYKRFLGGTASGHFTHDYSRSYGIGFPASGSENWQNDFLFASITSIAAYRFAVSSTREAYPPAEDFPLAYGYNTLLLDNDTASVLDMPTMTFLTSLRSHLLANETLNINASVYAYQATYNVSTADLRMNDNLWSNIIQSGSDQWGLSTIALYKGPNSRLGMMAFGNEPQVLFGVYSNSTFSNNVRLFPPKDTTEFDKFRKRAQIFNIKRARCRGYWNVTTTSISLVKGSCDDSLVDFEVLYRGHMKPYPYDTLPVFAALHKNFSTDMNSPWLRPTYATSIATMYWARGLQMISEDGDNITYEPMDETMTATRSILRAEALLYIILFMQPALTILGSAVAIGLHKIPVGRNFGVVSILSGLDPTNLALLRGAGLSGRLKQPVRLTVVTQSTSPIHLGSDGPTERIQYDLQREAEFNKDFDSEEREKSQLTIGRMYL